MLQSNVQTIQDSVPSELVKRTVKTLVFTFLSGLAGTPVHKLEAALGPERKALPQLTLMEFLWSGDGSYFPVFCSLYLLDEPTWSEHERHIHSFLEFARDLYAERGGGPYRLRDIRTELGHGRRTPIQPTSLIIGAHFSRSFGNYYHSFQGSPGVDLRHVEPGTAIEVPEIRFHLTPHILDYKDLDTSWEEQIKSRLVGRGSRSAASSAEAKGSESGPDQSHDVFISHASEDKGYCGPLVEALEKAGVRVWFDKTALRWGDDLRSAIDRGLRNCRYGIVIFSKAFLKRKKWTEYELSSLFALEKVSEKRILPIWHEVTHEDLLEYSAGLADRLAKVSSSDSYEDIVNSLCEMLGRPVPEKPQEVEVISEPEHVEAKRIRSRMERTGTPRPVQNRKEILPSPFDNSDDLGVKEIELLWSASKEPGDILHNITLDGESIGVNGRQFLAGVDARTGAEWIAAFRKLQERGYIEPLSHDSDFFRVTGEGYQAADALEEFARWDAKSVVLRSHYFRGPSDEITLSCTGIIAIPARYFDDQIAADGVVQRSLKEPRSLLVEGITSKPTIAWTPTEIEFLDPESKQVQTFRVEGMEFLRPRSLKLPLATETVRAALESADDGLHESVEPDQLPATEELTAAAEPDSESRPDGFLIGSRNAWVRFLEQIWHIIGPQILSITQDPASTIEDVRRAFLPAKEHPYDSGLATHFYRERIQQATAADVVSTGLRFDQLAAEILQATADRDQAARSCGEAEAALRLATNPKDKVEGVVQQRNENLTQLDAKLAELQRTQRELEETLRDQQAYVCRSELLDFFLAAEQPVDPRHIAKAVAALPRKTWRESVALCSPIPFDSYVQHEYQVFLVISAILKDQASDFSDGPIEAFRRALLKLPLGTPGQPFFWENFGDLKSVIEELGNSGPLDPFRLTELFLKRAMRQKNPLEKVIADSERLRA